jgi:transposase, IS5 family
MSSASRCRSPPRSTSRRTGIVHVKTLPGNPYDGHTLETVLPEIETQIGANLARIVADRGYRGHNAPPGHKFKVYISGQRRQLTEVIKRDLRRRSAVEPVIGHAKGERRMGRNFLKGAHGAAANAVLAAARYNFRRLLAWLAILWRAIVSAMLADALDAALAKVGQYKPELHIPAPPSPMPTTSRPTK